MGHRIAHTVISFDDTDPAATRDAFERITALAVEVGGEAIVWRLPKVPGPWSQLARVGGNYVRRSSFGEHAA